MTEDELFSSLGQPAALLGPGRRIVVCLSKQEVMETPGLFRALAPQKVVWTEKIRAVLSEKGLDVSNDARVYDLRTDRGWLFCNAVTGREAHDAFYRYLFDEEPLTHDRTDDH